MFYATLILTTYILNRIKNLYLLKKIIHKHVVEPLYILEFSWTFAVSCVKSMIILGVSRDIIHYYTISQEQEYICSKKDQAGMHSCNDLPIYNKTCNLTYEQAQDPISKGCVNWNQYYTECKESGPNPFQGTISFDNIGLAWVAIFLVSLHKHKHKLSIFLDLFVIAVFAFNLE